jgi:NhaP-type Na+/H+ or K+/H+ antiporter
VLATLVGQGLTLTPLIRWLGVDDPHAAAREERHARGAAVHAARTRLDALVSCDRLSSAARDRVVAELERGLGLGRDGAGASPERPDRQAILTALTAEREAVLRLWNDGYLDEMAAEKLEAELDLSEMSVRGRTGGLLGN